MKVATQRNNSNAAFDCRAEGRGPNTVLSRGLLGQPAAQNLHRTIERRIPAPLHVQ
jgi:hypothetical protein